MQRIDDQKSSSKIFRSSNSCGEKDSESLSHDPVQQFNLTSPQKKPPKLFLNDVSELNRK